MEQFIYLIIAILNGGIGFSSPYATTGTQSPLMMFVMFVGFLVIIMSIISNFINR